MEQYINKAAVLAELNRLIAELVEEGEDTMFEQGRISAFEDAKLFLDALEVKEVKEEPLSKDFEEAVENYAATGKVLPNGKVMINFQAEKAFRAGAKWQEVHLIDKACEWLSNISLEDMEYKYDGFDTSEGWYKFIGDFRKYMSL